MIAPGMKLSGSGRKIANGNTLNSTSGKLQKRKFRSIKEDRAYLEKAKEYFAANDYKACAIYLRTAFEEAIKKFCDKKRLSVRYSEDPKKLTSEDFWTAIKKGGFYKRLSLTRFNCTANLS